MSDIPDNISSSLLTRVKKAYNTGIIQTNGVWFALIGLIIFNMIFTRNFISVRVLQVNLTQMSAIAIAAIGMTLIIAVKGIDLSVGALMALAGAASGYLLVLENPFFQISAAGTLIIVLLGVLVAGVFGFINGYLIGRINLQPIIATLVMMISGRGIAQLATSGRLFTVSNTGILWLGRGTFLGISIQAWLMIIVFILAVFVTGKTILGRYVIAVGGNEEAARLAGINILKVKCIVYTIGGLLAGLAGILIVGINGTVDTANIGLGWEFTVISAVVVGGTQLSGGRPRIVGTIGGVALIQLLAFSLASHNVSKEITNIVQAGVIILAVALQSQRKA